MARKRSPRRQAAVTAAPQPVGAIFRVWLTVTLIAIYAAFLAHPIDLTESDLGRHLKNGELFIESRFIADTNLFAYTAPDQPFVNHHWGSGVIFYLIQRAVGFTGLSLFSIAISMLTLWLFFRVAARYGSFALAVLLTITVMPLLITRYEIRPEMFSYLLSGLFLNLLWDWRLGRRAGIWLYVIPLLQILWVNLHIYFFIGIFLVGVFLLQSLLDFAVHNAPEARMHADRCKALAAVLLATIAGSCVNPAGVHGAVYPLLIFQGYEFPVIENYSVAAILEAGFQFLPLVYFLIVFGALCFSWLYVVVKDRSNFSVCNLILTVFFSALAWWTIRNIALFALFALPLMAMNLAQIAKTQSARVFSPTGISIAAAALGTFLVLIEPIYFFGGGRGPFGIGLKKGNLAALEFIRRENLQGPIFNSFDVGGYLIYYLYPRQRVFVDNRPEAYPASFFAEDYLPLLANDEKWRLSLEAHGFNAIVINYRGQAAVGENFIVRRMLDPNWAAVFFDTHILILARRYGPNQPVITKYQLPRESILQKVD